MDPSVMKFTVDEVARGKTGLAGIGGILHNSVGTVLAFSFCPVM